MKTRDFQFEVPAELVAQVPADKRDASRLLVCHKETGVLEDATFARLPEVVRALRRRTGARTVLFVANDSRVYPARVRIKRESGARGEVFLLSRKGEGPWDCLLRPLKKLKEGEILLAEEDGRPAFRVESLSPPRVTLARESTSLDAFLASVGEMPLPPYIDRDPCRVGKGKGRVDAERYQTVYAGGDAGSAAAPTAGLHFTPAIMDACRAEGAEFAFVTLHVGLGTFSPVQTESVEDHPMHEEWCMVPEALSARLEVARAEARAGKTDTLVVFVGTTSLRAVESYFRAREGIPILGNASGDRTRPGPGEWFPTRLFLYPGDDGEAVAPAVGDALLTNFHQPESTLVMLVAALLGGHRWRGLYEHAVRQGYRFFSYGDASLLLLSARLGAARFPLLEES